MSQLFVVSLIITVGFSQTYSTTLCSSCTQLLSQEDCLQMTDCAWDAKSKTCGKTTTPVTPTVTYTTYCDSFSETDCPKAEPCKGCGAWAACAWEAGKCVQFTGCTPYAKTTDSECAAISNKCISDGTHCIELDACHTYINSLACVKNASGSLCYWDSHTKTCVDANICDKLPATIQTDAECRALIKSCTTNINGGCVNSGTNCSDQLFKIQCFWDGSKSQQCMWDITNNKCINKTCDAAPSSITTDEECKAFLNDGSCTVKENGGCITRGSCTVFIKAACVKNSLGGDCYWNTLTSKCVDKICENAPETITTNAACSEFAPLPANGCIAKQGGGCIPNGACSVAGFKEACVQNTSGQNCIWDSVCKEKICSNAPITNNTHELCTAYLSTCTVKTGGGCETRTCSNAPASINSNDACETYLPKSKCIAIPNGGCTVNTTCSAIRLQAACIKDANGNACFYDDVSSTCKDKICTNAPSTNITHELCQAFLTSCTVNSTINPTGCVSWTCENSLAKDTCTYDTNKKPCIWKGQCYKKQCALAPATTSTHADCNAYLNTCTLSDKGSGCAPIPIKCEAITTEAACKVRLDGSICGWIGSKCINQTCATAPKTIQTSIDCNKYKSGCVSANPVNGSVSGCIDLPSTCTERMSSDNCQQGISPVCLWSGTKCIEKTCDVATLDGTPGKVTASDTNCNSFLAGCLVSDDGSKCIPKVTSCSSLHSPNNCIKNAKVNGYCFWNGAACVDRTCANINKNTHDLCNAELDTCTINGTSTGCMALATECKNYLIPDQCKVNSAGKMCIWTGSLCRNATCFDAPNSDNFNTDSECMAYQTVTDTCTVTAKTGGKGCVVKSLLCSDYYVATQCHKTLSNTSATDDCKWINNRCYSINYLATGECSTFNGTKASCELYRLGCTNTVSATDTTPCTLDCTKKTGTNLTHAQCQTFHNTCTTGNGGNNCQAANASCSGYSSSTSCTYTKTGTRCFYTEGTCGVITQCATITGASGLTHADCQAYNTICTANTLGTDCLPLGPCNSYTSTTTCSYNSAGKKCLWYNDGYAEYCIEITTLSDCGRVIGSGLTDSQCFAYNEECYANSTGTACKLKNCGEFQSQATCLKQGDLNCYWQASLTKCIRIGQENCEQVTEIGLTHDKCAFYSSFCVANAAGTSCQKRFGSCSNYTTSDTCSKDNNNLCVWDGSSCSVVGPTDCPKIKDRTGLTPISCQAYNTSCTSTSDGTACKELSTCYEFKSQQYCLKFGAIQCFWNSIAISCDQIQTLNGCAGIQGTGLTNDICSSYYNMCVANSEGTACQRMDMCSNYLTSSTCTKTASNIMCYWQTSNGSPSCIAIASTSDCASIQGTGLTHEKCSSYQDRCTANSDGTACQELLGDCSSYSTEKTCSKSQANTCFWFSSGCRVISSVQYCQHITGNGLTDKFCSKYNNLCTVNSTGTACKEALSCHQYIKKDDCAYGKYSLPCYWQNDVCMYISQYTDCEKIKGIDLTDDDCQAYNSSCRAAAYSCIFATQCSDLQTQGTCTQIGTTKCYWYNSGACISINSSNDCSKVTGSELTFETCQSYNSNCSVNRAGNQCIVKQDQCTTYTNPAINCVRSSTGLCVSTTLSDAACQSASVVTTCEGIYLGTGRYTNDNCNAAKSGCTNNSTTACIARTCANYKGTPTNHSDCNAWLNTCTYNHGTTGCITMAATCSSQAGNASACLQAIEGVCILSGSYCIKKTCGGAQETTDFDSDSECSAYLSSCTVAGVGGCQPRGACTTYLSQSQCIKNSSGQQCFWNPSVLTCVDLSCGNVEQTTQFDSHDECYAVDVTLKCTVRATNGAAAPGCMAIATCSSYTIHEQCKVNSTGGECVWNTNLTPAVCQDKGCTTAPNTIATHNDCYGYYRNTTAKVYCTVVATPNPAGGLPYLAGCQQTVGCSSYIAEEQCKVNANNEPCGWNGTTCADKSCATAQSTVNTDALCRAYLPNCTVADSGSGCIEIPVDCSTLGSVNNCISNKSGALCYWTGTVCQTRTCDNAPDNVATAEQCNTYLTGCTFDNIKCKPYICEDYVFTTDLLCRAALSTCTTDGTKCVTRGTCLQAFNEAGCITAAPIGTAAGKPCQWIAATSTESGYCTEKSCATAPSASYTTEAQCAGYYTNCTTKSGGGCTIKSTCAAANVEAACTTALDATICKWDNNACRNLDCQDFQGSTHTSCQAARSGCTVGENGKCAKVKNCEDTKVRPACIEGLNGPCLWVDTYPNSDGTFGSCFSYTSCRSLQWNSDQLCKLASKKCTTDGTQCTAITLCSETNTSGGCITGYDGDCIQSIVSPTSTDPPVCKPYKSCTDAFYLTHVQCQTASPKCTSNGTTGCIPLAACSTYAKEGCYINNVGTVVQNGDITSTGICQWDNGCRDQTCTDLVGTTHLQCTVQLSKCTSDGTKCLLKNSCSVYTTQIICITALGTEGTCFWEQGLNKCRQMTCSDITNGTTTSICEATLSFCVSDGTNCVPRSNCQLYKTKTSCNSGGSDGICVFDRAAFGTPQTCYLMTACKIANNDEIACKAAKDRCKWTAGTTKNNITTSNSCAIHTCASYYSENGVCKRYLSWDKKTQQFCTLINGACTAIDPYALTSTNCYFVSGYTYTWNASSQKCQVCTPVVTTTNNTVNNTTTTTTTTTTFRGSLVIWSIFWILSILI